MSDNEEVTWLNQRAQLMVRPEPFYAERLCLTCARAIGARGVYISDSACYCRRCAEYVKSAIENALRETA